MVRRVDNISDRFKVKAEWLIRSGSHDSESEYEIQKHMEFDKLDNLLKTEGYTIEKIEGDRNCLFRAVARQVYGDPEKFQKVRDEVVDHVIDHRSYLSSFDADIDGRLSQQLIDRSWGGHLEIQAISQLYNVGIMVWELSVTGELVLTILHLQQRWV